MFTYKDTLAQQIAQEQYGCALKELTAESIASCYREAGIQLREAAKKQYEEDKEAAQTWGGDIDLVSFEGE